MGGAYKLFYIISLEMTFNSITLKGVMGGSVSVPLLNLLLKSHPIYSRVLFAKYSKFLKILQIHLHINIQHVQFNHYNASKIY